MSSTSTPVTSPKSKAVASKKSDSPVKTIEKEKEKRKSSSSRPAYFNSRVKKINSEINKELMRSVSGEDENDEKKKQEKKQGMEKVVPGLMSDLIRGVIRDFSAIAGDRLKRRKVKTLDQKGTRAIINHMIYKAHENCAIPAQKQKVLEEAKELQNDVNEKIDEVITSIIAYQEQKKKNAPPKEKKTKKPKSAASAST